MSLAAAAPAVSGPPPVPGLAEPSASEPAAGNNATPRPAADGEEKKSKRRGLFGFGKKKTSDEPAKSPSKSASPSKPAPAPAPAPAPTPGRATTASPILTDHSHFTPSSPGRGPLASSPRLSSPAGSQIFERDVQESSVSLIPNSPAIPSHIQTENFIPPVLDASSEAITDDHLDPDNVEIVTHASHQPASVAVTGIGLSPHEPSWTDELAAFSAGRSAAATTATTTAIDSASNYGSIDTADVRRLSFISFADVVLAEQQQLPPGAAGSRDSMHLAGLASLANANTTTNNNNNNTNNNTHNRSPSPPVIRSPASASPPPPPAAGSKSASLRGLDLSPSRKPLGSPTSFGSAQLHGPTVSGELAIETMSQALRRTGSGDLTVSGGGGGGGGGGSTIRSFPASPV